MFIIQLIYNLAVIATVSVVSGSIDARWSRKSNIGKILQGVIFGLIAILGMLNPFILTPGIIFDGRSIVLSLCALFFGPIAGMVAAVMAVSTRLIIGGTGTLMGVSVILSSTILGLLANFAKEKKHTPVSITNLYLLGLVVHIIMLILMFYLPSNFVWLSYRTLAISVLIFYPITTVIIGKILSDQENNLKLIDDLRRSEEKYKSIFANVQGVYYEESIDGIILEISPFIILLSHGQYQREELIGKSTYDLYANKAERDLLISDLKANGTVSDFIFTLKNRDGALLKCSVSSKIEFKSNGEPDKIIGNIYDITERWQAEEKIKTSLREKEVLLKEVHHRVKNNMQIISSLLNLQEDLLTDKKMVEIFKVSQNRIRAMALIHELMYKSPDFSSINIQDYFTKLIEHLMRLYITNKAQIEFDIEIDNVLLNIDKLIPLGLIANEIISNSLIHAFPDERHGKILLSIKGDLNENCTIVFSDNGIGIPEDKRANNKTLGLVLVNSLIQQIDAELETSSSEAGTVYKMNFKINI
ncbi:MAG: histidine kinase dimerization/phosphoacceptor domain -containing protein [Methanococcaceae archaeon]